MKKFTRNLILTILIITLTVSFTAFSACKKKETYTVTFDLNGGEGTIDAVENVSYNSLIDEPESPTRFGYTFDGWYSDARLTNHWYFDKNKVQSNLTLYAKWTYAPTESLLYKAVNDVSYSVVGLGTVTSKQIIIPDRYEGLPVVGIEDRAFQNKSITDVYIPDSVTSIGVNAFDRCSSLKNVTLSANLTSIPDYAFNECTALENIRIPSGVTSIGIRAFYDCKALSNVTLPSNLTEICETAFSGCIAFTSVTIPSKVAKIGVCAFSGCVALEEMKVAQGNSKYRSEGNCIIEYSNLGNVVVAGCKTSEIPSTATAIGEGAFKGCRSKSSVNIPYGITSIGESAFEGCAALTIVILPGSVKELGAYAFSSCDYLETVEFRDIDSSELESIGKEAFSHCVFLQSFVIPKSVERIGVGAFFNCGSVLISYRGTQKEFENVQIVYDDEPNSYSTVTIWFASENTSGWVQSLGGKRN
ncbi:MAG: leucine-rich repeat protein [Firmicutes bacterium]|nr:leucine-rich repeat protein [Bacillota bacterium]